MMGDWEYKELQKASRVLEEKGYSLITDKFGYKVMFGEEFVYAAGIDRAARMKPMHWRHAKANVRDNLGYAVRAAQDHLIKATER